MPHIDCANCDQTLTPLDIGFNAQRPSLLQTGLGTSVILGGNKCIPEVFRPSHGLTMALVDYFRLEPVCYPHEAMCETFQVELRCYE